MPSRAVILRYSMPCIGVLLLVGIPSGAVLQTRDTPPSAIKTALPQIYEDWKVRTVGPNESDAKARRVAELARPRVSGLRDPFTGLANLSCEERIAKGEQVVWEDDLLMVVVDSFDQGSKLLVTPKQRKNFPIDLSNDEIERASRVAAASCDALMLADGHEPTSGANNCSIHVNPPIAVSLSQLHIHVSPAKRTSGAVDDGFFRRASKHLRGLLGDAGCL
jgi:diadenosine tetraphosphate (Ap4A) HIT family hydrolase